jgi:tRNA(fMet)-specific endonuclease VapC
VEIAAPSRIALDTNRIADLFRGDPDLSELVATRDEVWIPLIVLAEIKAGFWGGNRREANEQVLKRFLAKSTVRILLPTIETAEFYSRLFVDLKQAGKPIPDNDLWIAALTVEHELALVTRDRHFRRIPQLICI